MRVPLALVAFSLVFLSGCTANTTTIEGYHDSPSPIGLQIIDARSSDDKETGWLSLLISSCDYGVRVFGDEVTAPSRLVILREDLEKAFAGRLSGEKITVTKYMISMNDTATLHQQSRAAITPVGLSVPRIMGSRCSKSATTGGWYSADEVTNGNSPLVIEIELTLAGHEYSVRSVHSPADSLPPKLGTPESAQELTAAIREAHAKLIAQIRGANDGGLPPSQ